LGLKKSDFLYYTPLAQAFAWAWRERQISAGTNSPGLKSGAIGSVAMDNISTTPSWHRGLMAAIGNEYRIYKSVCGTVALIYNKPYYD
jgi:hypothetical protein